MTAVPPSGTTTVVLTEKLLNEGNWIVCAAAIEAAASRARIANPIDVRMAKDLARIPRLASDAPRFPPGVFRAILPRTACPATRK